MGSKSVMEMNAKGVYDLLVQKAVRKGRTPDEVDAVYCWLLGYTETEFSEKLAQVIDYGTLFRDAPAVNPKYKAVTGVICGVRVEDIEDEQMRLVRCVDKMVDELSKGKKLEKVLRAEDVPATVDEYIASFPEAEQKCLNAIRGTIRDAIPDAKEMLSWGMPTYWKNHNLIHFAAQKKHIGLYPGEEAAAVFAEKLQEYECSKGTIRIPYSDELPLALIAEIARWCREHNA